MIFMIETQTYNPNEIIELKNEEYPGYYSFVELDGVRYKVAVRQTGENIVNKRRWLAHLYIENASVDSTNLVRDISSWDQILKPRQGFLKTEMTREEFLTLCQERLETVIRGLNKSGIDITLKALDEPEIPKETPPSNSAAS